MRGRGCARSVPRRAGRARWQAVIRMASGKLAQENAFAAGGLRTYPARPASRHVGQGQGRKH